jgi:hypothetical protein
VEKHNGDNMLSSFDLQLWALVNHILVKWHTFVIFKWQMYDCRNMKKGYLNFFVPADAPFRYEIVEFLKKEIERFKQEPYDLGFPDGSGKHPGVEVDVEASVEVFRGIEPYLDSETVDSVFKNFMTNFKIRMKSMLRKNRKGE